MADIEKTPISPEGTAEEPTAKGEVLDVSKTALDHIHDDQGRALFEQSLQYDVAQLELDGIKVRKKLDFNVLPMMMTTYMLSFLDKQTLNYSNAYGLQEDTHMKGNDYSWMASALYFGWLCGAWPSNLALQRYPIGRFVGGILFVWGAMCMLQVAVFNFSGFFAIRFFLGFVESCISPAWMLLTSMLWQREEQPLRTSFWLSMNGLSSILGALLSYGLGLVDGLAVPNWKLIYLRYDDGMGVVISLYLPDGPHNGKMFTEYERVVAEALLDPNTYLLLMGASYGILNGGVANFISTLIKGFGFNALGISLLQTPGGACEIVSCIVFGYLATVKKMMSVTIILGCNPGIVGLAGIMIISIQHRYNLVACAWVQNVLGSPIVLNWTLPVLNVAGHTKRSTVDGLYFIFYCGGNIAGPHIFFAKESLRYPFVIKGLITCYVACIVLQVLYTSMCFLQNRSRDRQGLRAQVE